MTARPKGKGVHRHGTAADLADQGQGYASSGESQFSRIASRGDGAPMMAHQEPRGPRGHGLPMADLIRRTSVELRHMQCDLGIEDDPKRRVKLIKNIEIKTRFLAKLNAEAAS
jgi:hypothetical protein